MFPVFVLHCDFANETALKMADFLISSLTTEQGS